MARAAARRGHPPEFDCRCFGRDPMQQAKIIDEIQIRRAGAAVGARRNIDSPRQHFPPAMRRVSEKSMGARAIHHAGTACGQQIHLGIIAVIHVCQQRRVIQQTDGFGKADGTTAEDGELFRPRRRENPKAL